MLLDSIRSTCLLIRVQPGSDVTATFATVSVSSHLTVTGNKIPSIRFKKQGFAYGIHEMRLSDPLTCVTPQSSGQSRSEDAGARSALDT